MTKAIIRDSGGNHFDGADIFLRQGDLDGACGPYCVVMALIALGHTTYEEITNGGYHGNSKVGKFVRHIEQRAGAYFYRRGTSLRALSKSLVNTFGSHIAVSAIYGQNVLGSDVRQFLNQSFSAGQAIPVILRITYGTQCAWDHWVVVVGLESHSGGEAFYLILDPSGTPPRGGECWNAKIEANGTGSSLPYKVIPNRGDEYRVQFVEAISLS